MGVEFEIRCSKCKERVILYKLREAFEPVRRIVDGSLVPLPHSEWLEALTNERSLWQIKQALKFTQRHRSCEPHLWNDHADLGDDEGPFYPEMDEDKTLPTAEYSTNKHKKRLTS